VLTELAGMGASGPPATPDTLADGFDPDLAPGRPRFGDLMHFTDPVDESRGTSMEVYLTPTQLPAPGTRSQRPIPASIRPAGYGGRDSNHAKGHLLADTLGGPEDERGNFVTLYHRFTRGDDRINETPMQQVEMRIRRVIEGREPGVPAQNVRYRVEAIGEGRLPDKMRIVAIGDRGYREVVTMPNW
jgi:hypothetical protein